jgi:hypothetical protein
MTMNNAILEYYQQIKNGDVIVGTWVRLIYEYIVKGLEDKLFFFSQKKANRAIRFIENFCHHSKGRNDLLKLELWQRAIVSCIFGIVDEMGVRIFREIVIIIGRKNGKSLFASAIIALISLYVISLPVVFAASTIVLAASSTFDISNASSLESSLMNMSFNSLILLLTFSGITVLHCFIDE